MGGAQRPDPAGGGRLWLVLGDSAAQAVGAGSRATGYVGLVLERLRADGTPWRVVNLPRSGDYLPWADGVEEAVRRALQPPV